MKKTITEYLDEIYLTKWEGRQFVDLKNYINTLDVPDNAFLEIYDNNLNFVTKRYETDEEYEIRVKNEEQKTEERDQLEYLRLKAKYEKSI